MDNQSGSPSTSPISVSDPSQYTILVSGATGQQGGAVINHLLDRSFRVRALTRDPGQNAAKALADRGAEVIKGHFGDRASLMQALDGTYGAYSVQTFRDGVEEEVRQGKAFADAAKDAGVRHFVYSSVGGAERNTGVPHFESKWQIEKHIRQLGLPATILRPAAFMENWQLSRDAILSGKLRQPLSPDTTLQQIAADDIGAFAALAFASPTEWLGEAVELAGDELSMTEFAEVFGRVLDREVTYTQVPWEGFEAQAGEETTVMYRWFESAGYKADIETLRQMYPSLKRLETYLLEQGWGS